MLRTLATGCQTLRKRATPEMMHRLGGLNGISEHLGGVLDRRRRSRTGDALERSLERERSRLRSRGEGDREARPTGERSRGDRLTDLFPLTAGETSRLSSSTGESAICAANNVVMLSQLRASAERKPCMPHSREAFRCAPRCCC